MATTPAQLRAQAAQLEQQARSIHEGIRAADRDATEAEETQVREIMGRARDLRSRADRDEARDQMFNDASARGAAAPQTSAPLPHQDPANTRNGRHQFSILRAVNSIVQNRQLTGLEKEVHQELLEQVTEAGGKLRGSFFAPWDLIADSAAARRGRSLAEANGVQTRALDLTDGAGSLMTETSGELIDILRAKVLMGRLGAKVMTNMQGKFALPKKTAASTFKWVADGVAITGNTGATIGQVLFEPNSVGGFMDFTRGFVAQTSLDAEMFVRSDLTDGLAVELDRVGFAGSGAGAEPEGLIYDTNIPVVPIGTNGGDPTWTTIVGMEERIDTANALAGRLAFVTNPKGRSKLKRTRKDAALTVADWIWERGTATEPGAGEVNSYPAYSTGLIPNNLTKGSGTALSAAVLGDFTQCAYALWGPIDLLVDPYTFSSSGVVRVVIFQEAEYKTRRPESFSVCKDMTTA